MVFREMNKKPIARNLCEMADFPGELPDPAWLASR
jgi:hypothetical protein